jgi:uncharacterized protein YneF (UPF0154 family)
MGTEEKKMGWIIGIVAGIIIGFFFTTMLINSKRCDRAALNKLKRKDLV